MTQVGTASVKNDADWEAADAKLKRERALLEKMVAEKKLIAEGIVQWNDEHWVQCLDVTPKGYPSPHMSLSDALERIKGRMVRVTIEILGD